MNWDDEVRRTKKNHVNTLKKTLVSVLFFLFSNNLHQIHVECGILFEQQGLETLSEGFAAETIFPNFRRRKCKYIITGKNIFMLVNLLRSIILKPFGKNNNKLLRTGNCGANVRSEKNKKVFVALSDGRIAARKANKYLHSP